MAQSLEFDVVIVGGGIAGMVAACRASQLGKKVAVLERGREEKYLCNTRYTGGTFHVCLTDIMGGEEKHRQSIEKSTAGFARPDLAQAVAHDAERTVRWLQSEGIKFMKASAAAYQGWVIAPIGRSKPGLDWEGRSGDVLLRTLEANLLKRGGKVFRNARARALIMSDRRCVGVEAETSDGDTRFAAGAVIIADGGFQGNPDLVRRNISPQPEKVRQRGAGTGVGDGLRMAMEAGAAAIGLDRFYGHLLSVDAFHNDMLWPYPYLDATAVASIVVDRQGKRFADEGKGGVYLANTIAQLADPLSATVIFDQTIWEGPGCNGLVAANPHLKNEGATLHVADTIEALAAKAGIIGAALRETIEAYNEALDSDRLASLVPPRHSDRYKPFPIRKAPFYAVPACAGITYTMGGIAIDEAGRAIDPQNQPIPGLYAAGAATGGLEGGPEVGYVGGLVKSAVMGLRSAENIAQS